MKNFDINFVWNVHFALRIFNGIRTSAQKVFKHDINV